MTNSLKWIFNEYEFDNRVNNLAWTVAGKYDEDIDISEKDYTSKDASILCDNCRRNEKIYRLGDC